MSLTDHLRDPGSPVRAYLEGLSPRLRASAVRSPGGRESADSLGLADLAASRLIIPRLDGVDGSLAGMAFDYRARIALGGFDALASLAAAGAARAEEYRHLVENGDHRVTVLQGAFEVAVDLLASGDELDADRASVLLAYCERVVRTRGSKALSGSAGTFLDVAADGKDAAAQIDRALLDDIGALLGASRPQLMSWQEEIADGISYEPNPHFVGAPFVDGADGDWLLGDVLVDSKVYSKVSVSSLRGHLIQLLGYVMLDLDDALSIRRVAIWLPRQQVLATWSLSRLLGGDPDELLPMLREGFLKATGRRQVARPEPVSERRRRQMLADNRHTPYEHLAELALSDDADIRRRVGRNVVTPEATVRFLAGDRSWSVREGVAMNEAAPEDVLQVLATDASKAVRRAVAGNPGAPRVLVGALTADPDSNVRWSARTNDGNLGAVRLPVATAAFIASDVAIAITADRDEASWDTKVLEGLMDVMDDARLWAGWRLPIPEASYVWAHLAGRDIRVPDWLRAGIPRPVAEDLCRADRPDWLRHRASWALPVEDPAVRAMLLRDSDPYIRWSTLKRTIEIDASDLSTLLTHLADSKAARVSFRRKGAGRYETTSPQRYDLEVLEVVAAHSSTPPSILAELTSMTAESVRLALIANSGVPDADRAAIVEALLAGRIEGREKLARIVALPQGVVETLANDKDSEVRWAVATRVDLSDETAMALASDDEWEVRFALIQNPAAVERVPSDLVADVVRDAPGASFMQVLRIIEDLPESDEFDVAISEALTRMSTSRARDVRGTVARHPLTPPQTLERLARTTDVELRAHVAGNISTPEHTLETLAQDDKPDVRAAVAENGSTPLATVHDLSHDGAPKTRAAVAARGELDLEILARLLEDDDAGVQRVARRHASAAEAARRFGQIADSTGGDIAQAVAGEPIDREAFETLAGSRRAEERMKAAYDERTPVDILEFLGGERSKQVRRAVAANPHAPSRLLRQLAEDDDEQVRQAVAFNGATTPEVLIDLAGRSIDLALMVALNPDVPDEVLASLASDTEPLLRYIATGRQLMRSSPGAPAQLPQVEIRPSVE